MDTDAVQRPRFKSSLEPIIDGDDGLFVLSERGNAWLPDPIFSALAPLIDGDHDVEAIFEALADTYLAAEVFSALDHLRTSGCLAEDSDPGPRATRAFWEHAGVSPSTARRNLDNALVSVAAIGEIDAMLLSELLACHGVTVTSEGGLTVVVTDDYLRPELAEWNRRSLESRSAWLLVKPIGIETWIGPAFVPGQTGCWACLAHRLRGHRRLEEHVARRTRDRGPVNAPPAFIPSAAHAALAEAATEITRWVATGGPSALQGRVVSTNVLTLERSHHALTRRPQCPSCGVSAVNGGVRPVRLGERLKVHASDGGHRGRDPREVLAELERHLSPITGIVSTLAPGERTGAPDAGGRWFTPTFTADHNFSEMHDERFFLREGMRRRSGGKGKSPEQARASALAESLERYCGVFDGTEPRIRASFEELGAVAIRPNDCMGYSERQYVERDSHNRRGHKAYWVPEPFRDDAEIEWTPLWSLTSAQTRYLPTSYCYFGYRSADPLFARADSNGCAAGSVLEEAVLQGLLELIERDAVALWWYNRLRRPALDLESAGDAYVSGLLRHYRALRRDLWVLDITSDLGVPTFAALSRRLDKAAEDIIYGFGTHLDPGVALTRALTELNQSLESVPTAGGPASSQTYRGGPEAVRWWQTVRIADASYLEPDPEVPRRTLQGIGSLASDDLYRDVLTCSGLAADRGIDVLILDQTRADIGLPVVRVVAQGLRHFWARFGPGRLYDVPVREGWLARAHEEIELNPFVIQF